MKKVLLFIVIAVALLFLSDKIYKMYSRNNVNSHETIVLFNNWLDDTEVDTFFGLEQGTYDPATHKMVLNLPKKDGYLLEYYKVIPAKKVGSTGQGVFECDSPYGQINHYGFYNYEVGNRNVIARIIPKEASSQKQLVGDEVVAQKYLNANYQFGTINVFDIYVDGVSKRCQ